MNGISGVSSAPAWLRPVPRQKPSWIAPRSAETVGIPAIPPVELPPPVLSVEAEDAPPVSVLPIHESIIPMSMGRSEIVAEREALRATVGNLATELTKVKANAKEELVGDLVKLSLAVAGKIIGRAVEEDPSIIAGWAREAVGLLPGKSEVTVALAPSVAASLPRDAFADVGRVIVDENLAPGTCEVREGTSTVEVSAKARLEAMAAELGGV